VEVPSRQLSAWFSLDKVGMSAEIQVRNGKTLEVLIEKDFSLRRRSRIQRPTGGRFGEPVDRLTLPLIAAL
jgi:hypothetical protein